MYARNLNFIEKIILRLMMPNLAVYKISEKITKVVSNSVIYKTVRRLRRK